MAIPYTTPAAGGSFVAHCPIMAKISGRELAVGIQFQMLRSCCRCGAPSTTTLGSAVNVNMSRTIRTIQMPYCAPCAERAKSINRARALLFGGTALAAAAVAFFGALFPAMPRALLILVPCVLALVIASLWKAQALKAQELPHGAWLVKATRRDNRLFCTQPEWAEEMARINETQVVEATRSRAVRPGILAVLIAGGLATYVSFAARPQVYVDNGGSKPLKLFVDGKLAQVVEPRTGGERAKMEVPYGNHRFGYGGASADKPEVETPVHVDWSGDHLYNPGKTACYWLEVTVYGKASAGGIAQGPQTISEFYTFKHMDNWFHENPKEISTKASGETRTAIQSMKICAQMSQTGCDLQTRESLIACEQKAYRAEDDKAFDACVTQAIQSCGEKR
jgi:hypothetical protein